MILFLFLTLYVCLVVSWLSLFHAGSDLYTTTNFSFGGSNVDNIDFNVLTVWFLWGLYDRISDCTLYSSWGFCYLLSSEIHLSFASGSWDIDLVNLITSFSSKLGSCSYHSLHYWFILLLPNHWWYPLCCFSCVWHSEFKLIKKKIFLCPQEWRAATGDLELLPSANKFFVLWLHLIHLWLML